MLAELQAPCPASPSPPPITADEMSELVEPWLGTMADLDSLPLPRLIDVAYNPGIEPDSAGSGGAPGHHRRRGRRRDGSRQLGRGRPHRPDPAAIGGGLGLLLLLLGMVVVAVVTRLSLDLHDETVDLLRLMGAGDSYVARQFEQHALSSGLRGGAVGFALAALTLAAVAWGLGQLADVASHDLRPVDWVLLACVPVVGILAATLTARITASTSLARLH